MWYVPMGAYGQRMCMWVGGRFHLGMKGVCCLNDCCYVLNTTLEMVFGWVAS